MTIKLNNFSILKKVLVVFGSLLIGALYFGGHHNQSVFAAGSNGPFAANYCGVHTGLSEDYQGAVIYPYIEASNGALSAAGGGDVYATITSSYNGSPISAIWNLANDSDPNADGVNDPGGVKVSAAAFGLYGGGSCNGTGDIVLGYGQSSSNVSVGNGFISSGGNDGWVLDCGVEEGTPATFTYQGGGLPAGATPGGYWTTGSFGPNNGGTSYENTYYMQPAQVVQPSYSAHIIFSYSGAAAIPNPLNFAADQYTIGLCNSAYSVFAGGSIECDGFQMGTLATSNPADSPESAYVTNSLTGYTQNWTVTDATSLGGGSGLAECSQFGSVTGRPGCQFDFQTGTVYVHLDLEYADNVYITLEAPSSLGSIQLMTEGPSSGYTLGVCNAFDGPSYPITVVNGSTKQCSGFQFGYPNVLGLDFENYAPPPGYIISGWTAGNFTNGTASCNPFNGSSSGHPGCEFDFTSGTAYVTITLTVPPPVVNLSQASCAATSAIFTASQANGDPLYAYYTVNGSHGVSNAGPIFPSGSTFTVPMGSYDQLVAQSGSIIVYDESTGLSASAGFNYGPCIAVSCTSSIQSNPASVEPNQAFGATAQLAFKTVPGGVATSGPPIVYGGVTISVNGGGPVVTTPQNSPGANENQNPYQYQTVSTLSTTLTGVVPLAFTFTDGSYSFNSSTCGTPSTVTVANHPYFVVNNGDAAAGSNFADASGSCNPNPAGIIAFNGPNKLGQPYAGAGAGLAAFAVSYIDQFASGTETGLSTPTSLTFSNSGSGNDFPTGYGGSFAGNPGCAPDYYSYVKTANLTSASKPTSTIDVTSLTGSSPGCTQQSVANATIYCYFTPSSGYISLDGCSPISDRIAIFVAGNVYMNDCGGGTSTSYATNWTSITAIPALAVVSGGGNIYIGRTVSALSGVFEADPVTNAANGEIFTCATPGSDDNPTTDASFNSNCATPLTVNGAFIAKLIHYGRTTGDVYNNTGVAETFNYNPEIWLANPFSNSQLSNGSPSYVSDTALQPVL